MLPALRIVNAAERIAGLGPFALEADNGDVIDEGLHLLRRDVATGTVARELFVELGVVALDGNERIGYEVGDIRHFRTRPRTSHETIAQLRAHHRAAFA